MKRICTGLGPWGSLAAGFAMALFLIGASAALPTATSVLHADPTPACTATGATCIGNVEFFNFVSFPSGSGSGGGCGHGATLTLLNDSHGAGFELSGFGGNPTCTLSTTTGGSFSTSASVEVAGINGYLLDDIYGAFTCGISGGVTSGVGTLDPGLGAGSVVSISCPTLPLGSTMLETGHSTFTPTDLVTETITLTGSADGAGAISLASFSDQFSSSPVPEPNTLVLFGAGLIGLGLILFWHSRHRPSPVS
jgi:hypothetical protein